MMVGELVGEEFVPWPSETAFGGNKNPKESGGILCKYRNSSLAGIPAINSCESRGLQES